MTTFPFLQARIRPEGRKVPQITIITVIRKKIVRGIRVSIHLDKSHKVVKIVKCNLENFIILVCL